MKDIFSSDANLYAKYRPNYPKFFFDYLMTLIPSPQNAWDCGTGNGQIAYELSNLFERVYATDISQSQIDNALKRFNIIYSIQPAEETNFEDNKFDLIIAGQAVHWFNFKIFYDEVKRTANSDAIICLTGYSRIKISEQIDNLITDFYTNILGNYWDKERKYIDENYQTISFPFNEIETPKFFSEFIWDLEHLIGYLNTWSAVKNFIKQNNFNPINKLQFEIEKYWNKHEQKKVSFPLLSRIAKIN